MSCVFMFEDIYVLCSNGGLLFYKQRTLDNGRLPEDRENWRRSVIVFPIPDIFSLFLFVLRIKFSFYYLSEFSQSFTRMDVIIFSPNNKSERKTWI